MVLIPILKSALTNTLKPQNSSPQVRFNLPFDSPSIVEYLNNEDGDLSHPAKVHMVVKVISSGDTENDLLLRWISEFRDNILILRKENEGIIRALLHLEWYNKDDAFSKSYQELIMNLVTAHAFSLKMVLGMIVNIFLAASPETKESSEGELKSLERVHQLLKRILELVPLSQSELCILLTKRFPYVFTTSTSVLLRYVKNLLAVSVYIPSKRPSILECIFVKLLQMDVHCTREKIEDAELEREEERESELHMEMDNVQSSQDMALPLANTLDLLLGCVFKYIQNTCFPNGSEINWEATKKIYKEILSIFDKLILPTHGICHVQYTLFYICSLKQELCEGFVDYLWKKVQNPSVGPVFRQIAAFYIGSILSRATYINISTVTACFEMMCDWVHRYIDAHTSEDCSVHGTFHSVCQTIFYVFAFRNKELLDMKKGYKFIQSLNFERMVTCRLNPLRYCDRTIVQNFASIARNHQIAYIYPVIEKNNRNLLYGQQSMHSAGDLVQLFFPFDPYLLKSSKYWVEKLFRVYNHSQKEEEIMDYNEEETKANDELFTYSTSPGFKKSLLLLKSRT